MHGIKSISGNKKNQIFFFEGNNTGNLVLGQGFLAVVVQLQTPLCPHTPFSTLEIIIVIHPRTITSPMASSMSPV